LTTIFPPSLDVRINFDRQFGIVGHFTKFTPSIFGSLDDFVVAFPVKVSRVEVLVAVEQVQVIG
jgi:hypothetical protein